MWAGRFFLIVFVFSGYLTFVVGLALLPAVLRFEYLLFCLVDFCKIDSLLYVHGVSEKISTRALRARQMEVA